MSRHLIPPDEIEIAYNDVPFAKRKYIRFAGASLVEDDPDNERTVVTVDPGSAGGFVGYARYGTSGLTVTPGADFDCGSVGSTAGDVSWIRNDSDPSTGLWIFGAPGLYTVELKASFLEDPALVTANQIGFGCDVYFGDQLGSNLNRSYTIERGIRLIQTLGASSSWGASFTITDYFDNGGLITLYWDYSSALTSITNVATQTILTKVI